MRFVSKKKFHRHFLQPKFLLFLYVNYTSPHDEIREALIVQKS